MPVHSAQRDELRIFRGPVRDEILFGRSALQSTSGVGVALSSGGAMTTIGVAVGIAVGATTIAGAGALRAAQPASGKIIAKQ